MPLRSKLSEVAANIEVDAATALLHGGVLRIYGGTQPRDADTPVGDQPLLAELTFGFPAFTVAVGGEAIATDLQPELSAKATGIATWFRASTRYGVPVLDGSVGLTRCNLNLSNTQITEGSSVHIDTLTFTTSKG
jgi:hypothetical protein